METSKQQIVDMYKMIRRNEAQMFIQHTGNPMTFDLWSYDTRAEITTALKRGGQDGQCGRIKRVLERFGYNRMRATKNGVKYKHSMLPELYAPILLGDTLDIFEEWPVDLVNQIYFQDVILRRLSINAKVRQTKIINGTNVSKKRRLEMEEFDREETKRRATEVAVDPEGGDFEDEYSPSGF